MQEISLRPIECSDIVYFSRWWRDKDLIALTSGDFAEISDDEVKKYFDSMIDDRASFHFMIKSGETVVGHIALTKIRSWYELQTVIGDANYWNSGVGTQAISKVLSFAKKKEISKIFLLVRPDNLRAIRCYEKSGFIKKKEILNLHNKNLPILLRMELNPNYFLA